MRWGEKNVKVSQQLNLQKMPTRVEWEEVAIRRQRGRGQVYKRERERMIDVDKKEETEDLVRSGRKVQMPAIQMSVGRAGAVKEV